MTGLVLTLDCANRPGIVAGIGGAIFAHAGNITEAQQFGDPRTGRFFMRVVFDTEDELGTRDALEALPAEWSMRWRLRDRARPIRVLILVSRFDHCLVDLLYRVRTGELAVEIVGVIGNHPRSELAGIDLGRVPYHHLPVSKENRAEQEERIADHAEDADLVVLARYMQVLSAELTDQLRGRCINIHHSFLPGFKGARPYHQAHARGVKLIGATAHFVTSDLDEGPIIDQDVERISHADTPDDLVRKGRDIERRVLARAVRHFAEDRVLLNDGRTVVFVE